MEITCTYHWSRSNLSRNWLGRRAFCEGRISSSEGLSGSFTVPSFSGSAMVRVSGPGYSDDIEIRRRFWKIEVYINGIFSGRVRKVPFLSTRKVSWRYKFFFSGETYYLRVLSGPNMPMGLSIQSIKKAFSKNLECEIDRDGQAVGRLFGDDAWIIRPQESAVVRGTLNSAALRIPVLVLMLCQVFETGTQKLER